MSVKRGFIDGCFDGFHYGHVYALFQSKQKCDVLVTGTHSDAEMTAYKKAPLYSYEERAELLKKCRFIDEFVGEVPYVVQNSILEINRCDRYFHGDETVLTSQNKNAICVDPEKYETYQTTRGISSTQLRERLSMKSDAATNSDFDYLLGIYKQIRDFVLGNSIPDGADVMWIRIGTGVGSAGNILNDLLRIREEKRIILSVYDEPNSIYNKYELAIILLGLSCVDDVVIEP